MESLEHAQKRGANILGEYLGGAITCDAYHMTDPRADGLGVKTCIELALKDSAIERDQVRHRCAITVRCLYVSLHEVFMRKDQCRLPAWCCKTSRGGVVEDKPSRCLSVA